MKERKGVSLVNEAERTRRGFVARFNGLSGSALSHAVNGVVQV
jgi:hypothetical protein